MYDERLSKEQANYRAAELPRRRSCETCLFYVPKRNPIHGKCQRVRGNVHAPGLCDTWTRVPLTTESEG
jgi:High potential iron-sulfur protein